MALVDSISTTRDRGRIAMASALRRRDMLDVDAFAELLNTTTAGVMRQRRLGLVLGLKTKVNGGYRYPAWQVNDAGEVYATIPALLERLPAWTVYRLLTQTHPELRCTGVEALRRCRGDEVLRLTHALEREL